MKVNSEKINENVFFDNFAVIKENDNFYGIYLRLSQFYHTYGKDNLISSGKTLEAACKKAKLLQIGFNTAIYYSD